MDDGFVGGNKKLLLELVLTSMVIYMINSLIDIMKEKIKGDTVIIGHANMETTMDIYAEVTDAKKSEVIENLAHKSDAF